MTTTPSPPRAAASGRGSILLYALASIALVVANCVAVSHAAVHSSSGSTSHERSNLNPSHHNASFSTNASLHEATDNETITFESLLLRPENMLLLHLQQLNKSADIERMPIEDTTTAPPKPTTVKPSPMPSTTTPVVLLPSDSSSSSSSSSSADPITPVIEVHGVPSPPTLVTAAASDTSADVSWHVPDDDGSDPIVAYEVAWLDEVDGKVAGTTVVPAVPTTTTISALVNGRSYAFKVRAKNVNGYSTWSAKSLTVSPLHPPDLCGRVSCSGHGTCFPTYISATPDRSLRAEDAHCICRPGFSPPDCSVRRPTNDSLLVWKATEWSACDSGCGGGQRTRRAICWDVALDKAASTEASCSGASRPSLTRICNGMECGSKLVSVRYQVETSFDEVLFSPDAADAFELAFTTEVAAALRIPRTRLDVTALKRGSIVVYFLILPASRVGEPSLNDIVERLQTELGNATSTLRSRGTFARRVETTGVQLRFSIADQTVAGGAHDISVAGLLGTVVVLCVAVAFFGLFLRKRHERLTNRRPTNVLHATRSEMKPMGIRTMA